MSEGFLRTLSPLLRNQGQSIREWLKSPLQSPLPIVVKAELDGIVDDLDRQATALAKDQPLFVVMLMGGTGVGKSTLMNALAGKAIAQASYTRPTTRDPVVYLHESIKPEQLDATLRNCRIATHDLETLRHKVIVDTPDLDSNDLANRETLTRLLPHADVVLYVGSQEKYHDQIGWELFKEQRKRRAFAFVLNKWDRCSQVGPSGRRPDDDLLDDLKKEGFESPKLFRTTAQNWVDSKGQTPANLPAGEQFEELRTWLELGLTRLEMEAVKARGVSNLFDRTIGTLEECRPPELQIAAVNVKAAWQPILTAEANTQADVLANTIEPYQQEIEHHFATKGQQRFRGMMAGYLRITRKLRYAGSAIRERVGVPGGSSGDAAATSWDMTSVAQDCAKLAEDRSLTARTNALASKLLVAADGHQFPIPLLDEPTRNAGVRDWRERIARSLIDSLADSEKDIVMPTGVRKITRGIVVGLANILPEITLIVTIGVVIWQLVVNQVYPSLIMVLMPLYATLGVLILFNVLISILLPIRWQGIRADFRKHLGKHLDQEFQLVYGPVPTDVATALDNDRKKVDRLTDEVKQIRTWVNEKETKSNVTVLYGM